jgi:hypothetical protein
MNQPAPHTTFSPEEIQALEPALKIGILATVNDDGLPHLTLISSLKANTPSQMTWGQFTEGLSKRFIRARPKVGWLIMTLDKQLWRGKATFTHTAQTGPEFEAYNNVPMFRYNAYFGVHTVYYMDLVGQSGRQALPMGQVVVAAVQTMIARAASRKRASAQVLNLWTRTLLNKLDNLKFLSYVGADGYPLVIPVIQAQAAGAGHILFSTGAYKHDLEAIPPGAAVAVFGMSLDMEDVLMRGELEGIRRVGGIRCGRVQVNWVYNPMPPTPQQIYPHIAVEPVTTFVDI